MMTLLETGRLILVPLTMQNLVLGLDSPGILAAKLHMPIVANLMSGVAEMAIRKKLELMRGVDESFHPWITYWLIHIKSENLAAGLVGFKDLPDAKGSVEIGYGIASTYQNRGYMTEAVEALVEWAFAHPECWQVIANTLPDNFASQKVLVKAGFSEDGMDGDEMRFSIERPLPPQFKYTIDIRSRNT